MAPLAVVDGRNPHRRNRGSKPHLVGSEQHTLELRMVTYGSGDETGFAAPTSSGSLFIGRTVQAMTSGSVEAGCGPAIAGKHGTDAKLAER